MSTFSLEELCAHYSEALSDQATANCRLNLCAEEMDARCAGLQTKFRRELTIALRGSGARVMRARVYALVDHSVRPVKIRPVASATILVRKGVEVSLHFEATPKNIALEVNALARAVAAAKAEQQLRPTNEVAA